MRVRLNPFVGWILVVIGVVNVLLSLWLLALGAFSPGLIIGPLLAVAGVRYLNGEYFSISRRSVSIAMPFRGNKMIPLGPTDRLVVEGGRLVRVETGGLRTRIKVSRWQAHPADWRALEAYVVQPQAETR